MEISHEEFITISNAKEKYEKTKEDLRTIKSRDELNKEEGIKKQKNKNRIISENSENAEN